jgi:hypothetical protein
VWFQLWCRHCRELLHLECAQPVQSSCYFKGAGAGKVAQVELRGQGVQTLQPHWSITSTWSNKVIFEEEQLKASYTGGE